MAVGNGAGGSGCAAGPAAEDGVVGPETPAAREILETGGALAALVPMEPEPRRPRSPEAVAELALELDRVLELAAAAAQTAVGRAALLASRPRRLASAAEVEELRADLERVGLWMALLAEHGPLPLAGIEDLRPLLELIRPEESWLAPRELLQVAATLKALARVGAYRRGLFAAGREPAAALLALFEGLGDFSSLAGLLEECIGEDEELKDGASPELQDIRCRIEATRRQIGTCLQEILRDPELEPLIQDKLITIRNRRYVLPLKNNFRQAIPGIIHDHSRSRQTCFVEPLESVALNNRLALLLEEERQEEIHILKMLAARLRAAAPELRKTLARVFALDRLQARALFGRAQRAVIPELVSDWRESGFCLKGARHPLLVAAPPPDGVVPIDLDFPPGRRGLVISGANTGGKTASLKTMGLLVLMARCGLPLPLAEKSRVPLFRRVFAAIGDEQNLAASLSTFSGHLLALKTILGAADGESLVLLDELGVGTDPAEGAALARAVLAELKSRGVIFLATTHYNEVKAWAYEEEGVSSVAVAFDPESFRPLYHLQYGVPGLSNALKVAENLGFPAPVVAAARAALGERENRTVTLAARLEKRLAQLDRHEKELYHLKQQARIERDRARRRNAELAAEREKVNRTMREQVAGVVREARERFREKLAELERARREYEAAAAVREESTRAGAGAGREAGDDAGASALVSGGPSGPRIGALRGVFNQVRKEVEKLLPEEREALGAVDFSRIAPGDRVVVAGRREAVAVVAVEPGRRRLTVRLGGNLKATLGPEKVVRHLPGRGGEAGRNGGAVKIAVPAAAEGGVSGHGALGAAGGALPVLNLVGKRVEEAEELLRPFLDRAVLGGCTRVELIHGHGTGRLRRGLHAILGTLPYVSRFYHPEGAAGGSAITIVELVER